MFRQQLLDNCSTIHQAIYRVSRGPDGRFYGFNFDRFKTYQDVIIVDEGSMVPQDVFTDLLSKGVPIIVIGDHGQLPPVEKANKTPFNLMSSPDYTLTTIHRNADGIKKLATDIRHEDPIRFDKSYDNVEKYPHKQLRLSSDYNHKKDIIIVGGNYTRVSINKNILSSLGFNKQVDIGMKLIALRNDWKIDPPIFNGQIFTVESISANEEEYYLLDLVDETGVTYESVKVAKYAFGVAKPYAPKSKYLTTRQGTPIYIPYLPFDHAYAITCHKSQGSEWDNVIVIDESTMFREHATRWIYTAVTRAAKQLTIYNFKETKNGD